MVVQRLLGDPGAARDLVDAGVIAVAQEGAAGGAQHARAVFSGHFGTPARLHRKVYQRRGQGEGKGGPRDTVPSRPAPGGTKGNRPPPNSPVPPTEIRRD